MEYLLASTYLKVTIGLVATFVIVIFYYSIDIYLFITRRDFVHLNVYEMHFTRNDYSNNDRRRNRGGDSLNATIMLYEFPLRSFYKNRWNFWRVILTSVKTPRNKLVLRFGKHTKNVLAPIRGKVLEKNVGYVLKRGAGLKFEEVIYKTCIVNDRSNRRRRRILQAFFFKEEDLKNFQRYLDKPPKGGQYFELFKDVVKAHNDDSESGFVRVRLIAS